MTELHSSRPDSIGAGAPDNEIEIAPAMIAAGARALLDDSDLMRGLGPTDAEIYAERVLRAAFAVDAGQGHEGAGKSRTPR